MPTDPLAATTEYRPEEAAGVVIAERYKLQEKIGEGGMGEVWLASQTQPVKRLVALKLVKVGLDSATVLARFESERQALALMDHPNIAKVLDAGTTEQRRPFFVMELVKGIPLTNYCDQHRLGLSERLELFRQVCSAVQHAHQKGIIHRDLKPTNILVESHADQSLPKVIDFGLAKATSGMSLTDNSLHSAVGTVAGTPLYMAPEQATFNALDIDTRADIFALGVILYELLTGTTPIQRETFKQAALDEMLRMIREVDPPTPSNRISSSDSLPDISANRHIEPARLSQFVRGDLDWIVMKALAKERNRRYESASAFAHDIERFLKHEPVSAGPPTARYRLKKFVRRNRGAVISASVVLLTLICGIVGTQLGLIEARRQTGLAVAAAASEKTARQEESRQRQQAEKRLTQIEKVNEILGSIFKDLNQETYELQDVPLETRLGRRLDQATEQIDGESIGDALAVARMQAYLGASQLGLGYPEKSVKLLTKARATFTAELGPNDRETIGATANLALSYEKAGQHALALPLFEQAVELCKANFGHDHPETISALGNLAVGYEKAGKPTQALALHEEVLALCQSKFGPENPQTLRNMRNVAIAYQAAGNLDRALPLLEQTLKLVKTKFGPNHAYTFKTMTSLSSAYLAAGKLDLALPLMEETFELEKATRGPDHPDTLTSMNDLAMGYQAVGRLDRALPLLVESLALCKSRHDPDHPQTLTVMNNLANAYVAVGNFERGLPLLEETLKLRKSKLGPEHRDTVTSMGSLGVAYQASGRLDLARPLLETSLTMMQSNLGPDHPDSLKAMSNLGALYWKLNRLDQSIPLFEECLKVRRVKSGEDHPDTLTLKANLGVNYKDAGRLAEALPLLEEANRASAKYPTLRWVSLPLLDAFFKAGRNDEAAALTKDVLTAMRASLPANSTQLASVLAQAGSTLLAIKRWAEAEPILRECLAIREKVEPDVWTTFNTKSLLGGALLGQQNYADAEPLLLAGYEGMKQREAKIPPQGKIRITEALERVVQFFEATDKQDEAARWRTELQAIKSAP